ncbi:hypothetical protein G9A89_002760 [Geosiphon pyriformis]|nr:hypothetical protein G9A89_002760 [Geosiphon pyriformis]
MEAWTGKKEASKSLKKIDKPSKTPKKDRERAAQIEAALRKYNSNILNRINRKNSVIKNKEHMDNPFDINKDKPNLNDTTKDMEDSESSLLSRMASSSSGQYSSKSLGKKPMLMEASHKEGWKTVVHGTKRHIYDLLGDVSYFLGAVMARNQEIRVDFSQVTGRDQAKEILANKEIESFLMAIDNINNQMNNQKKVLVRDIPLDISNKEVRAAIKKFGKSIIVRKDAIIEQKKTWEAKLVGLVQNCTAYYLSTTLDQIKA